MTPTRRTRSRQTRSPPPSPLQTSGSRTRTGPVSVAITGGIGAGKSAALEAFARHGAATISSDEIVHRLLRQDAEVRRALIERFGDEVIGEEGADRTAIARVVFDDPAELEWLEELLHPRVAAAQAAWRDGLELSAEPPRVVVAEVPLLYEAGADQRFDVVVVITASPEVRAARRTIHDQREQRLLPEADKAARADYVYENDGTLEELDAFVGRVMENLRE